MQQKIRYHIEKRARFEKMDIDPDIALLNTGPVRTGFNRSYAKKQRRDKPARNGKWCIDCGKQGYATEAAARDVLGNVARGGHLTEAGSFAIQPYICVHGWWHIGRNFKVLKVFADLRDKLEKKDFPISVQLDRVEVARDIPAAVAPRRIPNVHDAHDSKPRPESGEPVRLTAHTGEDQDPLHGQTSTALRGRHALSHLPGASPIVMALRP